MIDPDPVVRSPRFMERRRAVRAERRRVRFRLIIAVASLVVLAVGGFALTRSPLFAIESVSVVGAEGMDPDAVRKAAGLKVGDPGLRVDLDGAARRVRAMPGVEGAKVTRDGSLQFTILVDPRTASIILRGSEGVQAFDHDGVSVVVPKKVSTLPLLESDEPDAARLIPDVLRLWRGASKKQRATIDRFRITADGLVADLKQGRVTFGDGRSASSKVEAWRLVAARVRADGRRLISLDVRAPERPAVRVA